MIIAGFAVFQDTVTTGIQLAITGLAVITVAAILFIFTCFGTYVFIAVQTVFTLIVIGTGLARFMAGIIGTGKTPTTLTVTIKGRTLPIILTALAANTAATDKSVLTFGIILTWLVNLAGSNAHRCFLTAGQNQNAGQDTNCKG